EIYPISSLNDLRSFSNSTEYDMMLHMEKTGMLKLVVEIEVRDMTAVEALQADCDVKDTNIILQGLPLEVYALVNTHKVAKELWERIQMLMQGVSLTKQERECKLYDEFDKFAYRKGS
nr:integrase, catalytic region, zinc finger, CCHC-type, peptidase aspartic, catalytic [Tanacetum cinerariifolium]